MSPRNRILPVFIPHLGCPYRCVFCNQNCITGTDYAASVLSVKNTLEAAGCRKDQRCDTEPFELAFYGGSFTAIPLEVQKSLLSIVQPFRQNGWIRSIRCSTRPDAVSPHILSVLSEYGVETVELGCQSMDEDVLLRSKRGHSSHDVKIASNMVKEHGMKLILQMMTGLPGSTPQKDLESAVQLLDLCPDGVRIYPTVILKNTELHDLWKRGQYSEHTIEEAVRICSEIVPLFQASNIPIIRLGLNPNDDLSGGEAVGGAYHPAFGELVYSRMMRNKAEEVLLGKQLPRKTELHVAPSFVSKMNGIRKNNILALDKQFPETRFVVVSDPSVPEWQVAVPLQIDEKNSIFN